MASLVDTHEGEVAAALHLAILLVIKGQALQVSAREVLVARPLQSISPSLVSEPVADVIGITGVDKDGNLLDEIRDETVEGLGPVTLEQKVPVDVGVAALVVLNFSANGIHDILLVQVIRNPGGFSVAQVLLVLALLTDIVHIVTSSLERTDHSIVAVDGTWDTGPGALRFVATLDERLATGKSVVHGLTFAGVKDRLVATLTTGHRSVLSILGIWVGQTVTDSNTLQVDVSVLVGEDLVGKDRNVVAGVRFARDVEGLLGILGEVMEEQSEESIDVLACRNSVVDGVVAV